MLWLGLYLPHLPLEVYTRGDNGNAPLVVTDVRGAPQRVHACNETAARAGIRPGMALGAVHALLPDGRPLPRNPDTEQAALEGLADWAGQFTATLSLLPPQGLLLEIGASLALFGGVSPLQDRVRSGIEALGYQAAIGIAPTPLGAWLLARAGGGQTVLDKPSLRKHLARLSLERLELEPDTLSTLRGMGLRHLGDCLRLPRAGLARRLGPGLVDYLDRALGHVPDPRPAYTPPESFQSHVPLPAAVNDTEALLFAARRLLLELSGFLRARGSGVQQFHLELSHYRHAPSRLIIGLVAPSRDAEHLLGLTRMRLERFRLPAPVETISLDADLTSPLPPDPADLFDRGQSPQQHRQQLLEQLRARLGNDAIHGCCTVPDHRPEQAWRRCQPGEEGHAGDSGPRPLWLLEEPVAFNGLGETNGMLRVLSGPERIESGWWNGRTVRRDYFVMEDADHRRLWIFRELKGERRWFLHGIFA